MRYETRHFTEELAELKRQLLVMGELAEQRVKSALGALIERDHDLMAAVIAGDEAINRLHVQIDDRSFKLLALRQPMAVDLRQIVSALKISSDLERIGDYAANIGKRAIAVAQVPPVKPLHAIPRMGRPVKECAACVGDLGPEGAVARLVRPAGPEFVKGGKVIGRVGVVGSGHEADHFVFEGNHVVHARSAATATAKSSKAATSPALGSVGAGHVIGHLNVNGSHFVRVGGDAWRGNLAAARRQF